MTKLFTDEELKPILLSLLETGIGCQIGFSDVLVIYEIDDGNGAALAGKFAVCEALHHEKIFDKAADAVDFFLKVRSDREIGFDFQRGLWDFGASGGPAAAWSAEALAAEMEDDLRPEYDLSKLVPVPPEKRTNFRKRHETHHHDIGGEG